MVLEIDQIHKILQANLAVSKWVSDARDYNKTLEALVLGKDFKTELSKIEHIEKSEEKWEARQKYTRSIKDLNERLLRLLDNVYSATGGSKLYNVKDKDELIKRISSVRDGKSLEKWLENNWMLTYHTDPNGVTFLEYKDDKAYPTYKNIHYIRNYKCEGQYLKWILFEPEIKLINGENKEVWRFVDSAMDYQFYRNGKEFYIIEDLTFANPFGHVPGYVNSDMHLPGEKHKISPLDKIIEIQQEYLRDQSVKTLVKFLNGFKNLVRPRIVCGACGGTGKTRGDEGDVSCTDCSGEGYLINRDVTDEIVIPIDLHNPDQNIPDANSIASWIGLDSETWDKYDAELKLLEVMMYESLWGTHMINQDNNTATAKFIDTQPVINKLNKYSNVAEWAEWWLTELLLNFYKQEKDRDENQVSINYGRRFIIDPPDELLKKYIESKKENAPVTVLDRMLEEYLTSKYKNDSELLYLQLTKKRIEPYPHYTVDLVNTVFGTLQAQRMMVFNDWWESLTIEDLKNKRYEQLENEFNEYINNLKIDNNGNGSSNEEEV